MTEKFQPGDRVLNLHACARSAAVFVGLVAAPVGAAALVGGTAPAAASLAAGVIVAVWVGCGGALH